MRADVIGFLLSAILFVAPASAHDPDDPKSCNTAAWRDGRVLTVAKVTQPRVHFIKSRSEDGREVEGCPAAIEACRTKSYLVAGDIVLVGKTQGDFTCVSYKAPQEKAQIWTTNWLPNAALAPVVPMPSPTTSDWIGRWCHPGCSIEITKADGDGLHVEGLMLVQAGQETRNGSFDARVTPRNGTIRFDDGYDDGCRVRMQRVGALLLVQDNGVCGGYGVTFTGLYRRKN